MRRQTTAAPDFTSAKPYPSAGEKIGPAWQRIWDELHDLAEADGAYLGAIVATETDLTEGMVTRLLREAVAAGWLRCDGEGRSRRNRVYALTYAARCHAAGALRSGPGAAQPAGGSLGYAPAGLSAPDSVPETGNRHRRIHG